MFRDMRVRKEIVMGTDRLLDEVKIKMTMRLRGVSRQEAVRLVKDGEVASRAALKARLAKEAAASGGGQNNDGKNMISAEEFFGRD